MIEKTDSVIHEIMQKYPEDEWLDRCRAALPDADDAVILTSIEILIGGDVDELDD